VLSVHASFGRRHPARIWENARRSPRVRRDARPLMQQLSSLMNDYPCPDPSFHPAPGQSLYDFLIEPVLPLFDDVTGFEVTFDGVPIVDPLGYRFTSDDLFHFKGDPTMRAFDTCVTGHRQPAVSDGFYLMFKPMSPGQHTLGRPPLRVATAERGLKILFGDGGWTGSTCQVRSWRSEPQPSPSSSAESSPRAVARSMFFMGDM